MTPMSRAKERKVMTKEEKKLRRKLNISRVRVSFWKDKVNEYKEELKNIKKKEEEINIKKAESIISLIRNKYSLPEGYNKLQTQKQYILDPIYKAVKLIDNNIKLKLRILGDLFNKDRTTINYILRTIDDIMDTDKSYKAEYESILHDNNLVYKRYKPRK